jgi:hypothetical protein
MRVVAPPGIGPLGQLWLPWRDTGLAVPISRTGRLEESLGRAVREGSVLPVRTRRSRNSARTPKLAQHLSVLTDDALTEADDLFLDTIARAGNWLRS